MRAITFFALVLLTASAFNLTNYHMGFISIFRFNSTQIQDSLNCVNALEGDYNQIYELIMTKDFVNIAQNLGDMLVQFQSSLGSVCASSIQAEVGYLANQTNISNLKQTMEENFKKNYLFIIEKVFDWGNYLADDQDYNAGVVQNYILQSLLGKRNCVGTLPSSGLPEVPFNASEFFTQYYGAIFTVLGIQAQPNVSALVECYVNIQNVTVDVLYAKEKFDTDNFEEKLNAVQYLFGLGFKMVKNCEGAAETENLILGPIAEAFSEDPVHFTFEVINRIGQELNHYVTSIEGEITAIKQGRYSDAGFDKVGRLLDDFNGLVNFTSTD